MSLDQESSLEIEKATKYIKLAKYKAELFSKDPHTKVGAIALPPDFSRVLSTGVNGFVRHMDDSNQERWQRPQKYAFVQHAESNLVANAARTGTPLDGAVVAVTKFPCSTCTKLLIQAGVSKVYAIRPDYENKTWGDDARVSEAIMREVGIEIFMFDEEKLILT